MKQSEFKRLMSDVLKFAKFATKQKYSFNALIYEVEGHPGAPFLLHTDNPDKGRSKTDISVMDEFIKLESKYITEYDVKRTSELPGQMSLFD